MPEPVTRATPDRPDAATRVRGLFEAHRLITADLPLPEVLDRLVRAARDLVGAEHAAIGVLAPDGSIEQFVHTGLAPEVVARIAHGTPPQHPALRSFLAVPISVRGAAFGELYLADPAPERFDGDAEDLVTALAASAGTAIEHARLADDSRRSRDWLTASGELARALLADADEGVLLDVVSQALDVADADYASLILPTDGGRLKVTIARGVGADEFLGRTFDPAVSPLGRAIVAGRTCATGAFADWTNPGFPDRYGYGPAMLAPLVDAQGVRGAVLLVRRAGRPPFLPEDVLRASTFAAQVALALELNDARGDAEWLQVVEDRHRIAQDLHDNVMQRLFATGVGLEALADRDDLDPAVADRLRGYVTDLDQTIEQIRARVFGLRAAELPPVRHQRGRYPRVAPATATGAPESSGSAQTGMLRRLGPPTGADRDRGVPSR
jgi:GAF domain-containing protein